jgi:hypothetical protein
MTMACESKPKWLTVTGTRISTKRVEKRFLTLASNDVGAILKCREYVDEGNADLDGNSWDDYLWSVGYPLEDQTFDVLQMF